jgi:hypothetical protein
MADGFLLCSDSYSLSAWRNIFAKYALGQSLDQLLLILDNFVELPD